MSDTMSRDEQRDALDEFARTTAPASSDMLPAVVMNAVQPAIVGAQLVAVRRDTARVLAELKTLAAAAGSDWYYRFPVQNRKEGRTDWIEGPSIKLANDLARLYGNCEVDCRAQDMGSVIMYHARFLDLETGFALTRPFQQRKGASKIGGGDEQRREDITFQIGASKAIRNVVTNALQTFADFAFEEAKNALVEKIGKNLVNWRDRTIAKLSARLDIKRVEAVVGRRAEDWLAPDVAKVIAMGKAVEDGMASLDETFPPLRTEAPKDAAAALDDFAGSTVDNSGASGPAAGEQAAPVSSPPEDPTGAADALDQTEQPVDTRAEIAVKIIALATDTKQSVQDRLEALEFYRETMLGNMPEQWHDFVKTATLTAARVAKDEMPAAAARKYLQGLVK